MGDRVPVVPGDGRVACQHCPARVRLVVGHQGKDLWFDPERESIFCAPDIRHKPMPTVRLVP